jgi:DNA-binding IclR family transcriptional regulator
MTAHAERPADAKPGGLQGLDRALMMISRLAEEPMPAKRLADELGIKWSTAHRTLSHLRNTGCLTRDEATGVYHVGPKLYFVGSSYLASLPVIHAARMELRVAADETASTAQLVARYERRSMNLLVIESDHQLVPRSTIDFHFPLHCGSKGQVLLAFADPEDIDAYVAGPLEALTRHTIIDPDELRERLAEIRRNEYAITQGDVQLTSASVAAPIWDVNGAVETSVTLITSYNEFEEKRSMLIDVVTNAARSISLQLGWRPGAARADPNRVDPARAAG